MGIEQDEQVEDGEMRPEAAVQFCFLNDGRACGADCMAYVTFPRTPPEASDLSAAQTHCAIIAGTERIGRSAVIIASHLVRSARRAENAAADKQREGQFPSTAVRSPFNSEAPKKDQW